jgi:hypothetical protein
LIDDLLRLLGTALLSLMPLHWIFVIMVVACFSLTWALPVGVILFAYPQLTWERNIKKPIRIWNALKQFPLVGGIFFQFLDLIIVCSLVLFSNISQ